MTKSKANGSRRQFFKKVAVAAGWAGAAAFVGKFISTRTDLTEEINKKRATDLAMQKELWLQKRFVPMTEKDKQRMLNQILDAHNEEHT